MDLRENRNERTKKAEVRAGILVCKFRPKKKKDQIPLGDQGRKWEFKIGNQ